MYCVAMYKNRVVLFFVINYTHSSVFETAVDLETFPGILCHEAGIHPGWDISSQGNTHTFIHLYS